MSQSLSVSPARRRSVIALLAILAVLGALLSVLGQASSARADGGTASVSGTVTDASTSSPVAGISVYISSQDGSYFDATITAGDGSYTLSAIPAGSYTLQFQPGEGQNYVEQCWQGDSCVDGNQSFFAVTDGQALTGFDAALAPGATITGTVTDSSGNPIPNVNVGANSATGGGGATSTNDSGTYTIVGLIAGKYTVDFQPFAGNFLEQWWNNQPTEATANSVTIAPGAGATGINAELATGATISGTVSTAAGPLAGALVQAFNPTSPLDNEQPGVTAADGSYTITGLPSGSYKVQFTSPDGQNLATQWWNDANSEDAATPVIASTSSPVTGIDATLAPGASISGRIFAPGTPKVGVANASVSAYPASGGPAIEGADTDANGHYTIQNLPAGSYTVGITNGFDSGVVASEWWGGTFIQTGAKVLTLTTGQAATGISQQLIVGSPISGTVKFGATAPAPGVLTEVDIWSSDQVVGQSDAPPFEAITDDAGNYTLPNMGPGKYTIDFLSLDPHFSGQWWKNKRTQANATQLTVKKDVAVTGVDATLAPVVITPGRPSISGRAHVGSTLTAHHGTWKPKGMIFTYQWLQNGQPIDGATASTYVPTSADLGDAISVAITGTTIAYQSEGISQTVTSASTAPVKAATS